MTTYYCETCGVWFRAKAQVNINHTHPGIEPNILLCKPVGLANYVGEQVGVKPIYAESSKPRWRALLISVESGYSDTPSWGNEAGAWIHYTYETMRDADGEYIEAPTEETLIAKLRVLPFIKPSSYFTYKEPELCL